MIYQYLLFLDNNQVTVVYKERKNGRKLQYITNQGEKKFPLEADFWEWWKSAVSYIDGEAVDFCFLYDKNYPIINHAFQEASESCWNMEIVEDFLREMTEYTTLLLISEDGTEIPLNLDCPMFSDSVPSVFYTNIPLKRKENLPKIPEKSGISLLARYCRELGEEN